MLFEYALSTQREGHAASPRRRYQKRRQERHRGDLLPAYDGRNHHQRKRRSGRGTRPADRVRLSPENIQQQLWQIGLGENRPRW